MAISKLATALACTIVVACGSGSSTPVPPTSPTPTAPPTPPAQGAGINGIAVDAISDRPLSGATVKVDGLGETVTTATGSFHLDAGDPQLVRGVNVSSSQTVERATRLRVPGPDVTLTLLPTSLDLVAFDQMFRNGGVLHRWTSAPRVVVQNRVLQFTNITDIDYAALGTVMPDTDATSILADLTWTLPQLTGNAFSDFADQQRETAAEGERVRVSRPGLVVVARYEGLTAATSYWGYTRWSWNGAGELTAAIIMLDRGFDTSSSPFKRSLRAHEFGHALGYNHVTGRPSVMNQAATIEPNTFDRDGGKFAFRRPPLNRSPDIDPEPFTGNLRALTSQIYWAGDR